MAPLLHSSTKAEVGTKAKTERLCNVMPVMILCPC
jgi:hypothetical protein